ncbi:MAG: hypothetical protein MJ058_06700 [Akkermansia sp.]|nr:hypothetical protein [Akkermansia sp.]
MKLRLPHKFQAALIAAATAITTSATAQAANAILDAKQVFEGDQVKSTVTVDNWTAGAMSVVVELDVNAVKQLLSTTWIAGVKDVHTIFNCEGTWNGGGDTKYNEGVNFNGSTGNHYATPYGQAWAPGKNSLALSFSSGLSESLKFNSSTPWDDYAAISLVLTMNNGSTMTSTWNIRTKEGENLTYYGSNTGVKWSPNTTFTPDGTIKDIDTGLVKYMAVYTGAQNQATSATISQDVIDRYAWNGLGDSAEWNTTEASWLHNGTAVQYRSANHSLATFDNKAEAHTVTLTSAITAGDVQVGDAYTFNLDGGSLTASTLTLAGDSAALALTGAGAVNAGVISAAGKTISVASDIVLQGAAGSSAVLAGSGTYKLASGQTAMGDVTLGGTWQGTVELSGQLNNLSLGSGSTLFREGSAVSLNGVSQGSSFASGNQTIAANVVIGSGGAHFRAQGAQTVTFAGSLGGTGDLKRDNTASNNATPTWKFTGDVSGFTGSFINDRCHNDYGLNIVFDDSASAIKADIKNGSNAAGTLTVSFNAAGTIVDGDILRNTSSGYTANKVNVNVNTDAIFNGTVTVNALTLADAAAGHTLTLTGATTVSSTTSLGLESQLSNAGTLTLGGTVAFGKNSIVNTGNGSVGFADNSIIFDITHLTCTENEGTYTYTLFNGGDVDLSVFSVSNLRGVETFGKKWVFGHDGTISYTITSKDLVWYGAEDAAWTTDRASTPWREMAAPETPVYFSNQDDVTFDAAHSASLTLNLGSDVEPTGITVEEGAGVTVQNAEGSNFSLAAHHLAVDGTLKLATGAALGDVAIGGELQLAGQTELAGAVTGSGKLHVQAGGALELGADSTVGTDVKIDAEGYVSLAEGLNAFTLSGSEDAAVKGIENEGTINLTGKDLTLDAPVAGKQYELGTVLGDNSTDVFLNTGSTAVFDGDISMHHLVSQEGTTVKVGSGATMTLLNTANRQDANNYSTFYGLESDGTVSIKSGNGDIRFYGSGNDQVFDLGHLHIDGTSGTAYVLTVGEVNYATDIVVSSLSGGGASSVLQVSTCYNGQGSGEVVDVILGDAQDHSSLYTGKIQYGVGTSSAKSGSGMNLIIKDELVVSGAVLETTFSGGTSATITIDTALAKVAGLIDNSTGKTVYVVGTEDEEHGINRILELTGAGDYTYKGALGTHLDLVHSGEGTQSFTGDLSAFNGSVTVSRGSLVLVNSGETSTLNGTVSVADSATLTMRNMNIGAKISGKGTIEQNSEGTTNVTGDLSDFQGNVQVARGTLNLMNIEGSGIQNVTIASGSTLGLYKGMAATPEEEATLWITEGRSLTVGEDGTLNADLVMKAGSELDVSRTLGGGLTMGSKVYLYTGDKLAVSLEGGTSTTDMYAVDTYLREYFATPEAEYYTLFTDMDEFYIDDTKQTKDLGFRDWKNFDFEASRLYTNLIENTYALVYRMDENGRGTVALVMLPEPTTGTLGLLALAALAARRRRK